MEQKRTLWIIAAAGMFLLVVLGAAFILYSPAQTSAPSVIASNQKIQSPASQTQTGNGWTNVPPAYGTNLLPPVPGEVHTKDLTVYSENAVVYGKESSEGTTIDLNALKAAKEMAPAQETYPQNINITVNLPETKVETAPSLTVTEVPVQIVQADTSASKAPVAVKEAPAAVTAPAPVTVKKAEPVKAAPVVAAKTPAKTAETKVVEKKQTVVAQYWVQAAAYSNKKTAENARSVLDENKIPADIFTYQDAKGKVFYRVRVGPYTTKSEAEYWRTKIDKIAAFSKADSYITTN